MSSSFSDSSTLAFERCEVTLRASGPLLMYQLYRSRRELPPAGWRNNTIALLEPARSTSMAHVMPSGERQVFIELVEGSWVARQVVANLADELRRQRLSAGVPRVDLV